MAAAFQRASPQRSLLEQSGRQPRESWAEKVSLLDERGDLTVNSSV